MSRVNPLSSLSLLAVLVLAGCSSQAPQPLKKGEKAIDVASVVRQKMPASVKDRDAWAKDLATTFESQGLAPTLENVCSVLAVAQQESNYQADPAVPGLSKIAWQEIDRRAERMHIPAFLVHTALKIKSPNGKSYSERLDSVRTEKQLSAIFDDLISMVPMGQTLFGSLNPVRTGGPMQVSIAFAEQHTKGYPWKMDGTVRQEVFSRRGGLWFGTYHLLNYPASYSAPIYRFADFNAGWYASRNAAFQNAVSKASGVKLTGTEARIELQRRPGSPLGDRVGQQQWLAHRVGQALHLTGAVQCPQSYERLGQRLANTEQPVVAQHQ